MTDTQEQNIEHLKPYLDWCSETNRVLTQLINRWYANVEAAETPEEKLNALCDKIYLPIKGDVTLVKSYLNQISGNDNELQFSTEKNGVTLSYNNIFDSFSSLADRLKDPTGAVTVHFLVNPKTQALPSIIDLPKIDYNRLPKPSAHEAVWMLLQDLRYELANFGAGESDHGTKKVLSHDCYSGDSARAARTILTKINHACAPDLEVQNRGNILKVRLPEDCEGNRQLSDALDAVEAWCRENPEALHAKISSLKKPQQEALQNIYLEEKLLSFSPSTYR